MDLFSFADAQERDHSEPLAYRMRPTTLDEVLGQSHIIGKGTLLRRAIETDKLHSVIFYGPPGTGKTTLAEVIANATSAKFEKLNAVTSGVADLRKTVEAAQNERSLYGRRTVLFVDEIHRFNKAQQDALLPHVERGLIILVGATTENPYFSVNSALLSRSHLFQLQHLTDADIKAILLRALTDEEHGLGQMKATVSEDAIAVFVHHAKGDARRALNALELAVLSAPVRADGAVYVGVEDAEGSIQSPTVLYDKSGDEHYDTISAFIKSVRGSDADAALLWLAKMIVAGEDPMFIARRLVILASEDIGNADSCALPMAVAGMQALLQIGMPEGRIILAQVTTYLAKAKKSNASYKGINEAISDVERGVSLTVPPHLRGSNYAGAAELGHGKGYLYPHDYPGHFVEQDYWPVKAQKKSYYVWNESEEER
jgi:putative ATPase